MFDEQKIQTNILNNNENEIAIINLIQLLCLLNEKFKSNLHHSKSIKAKNVTKIKAITIENKNKSQDVEQDNATAKTTKLSSSQNEGEDKTWDWTQFNVSRNDDGPSNNGNN